MAIKIGETDITGIYLGTTEIKRVYQGETLIWEKESIDLERNANYIYYENGDADWVTVTAGTKYVIKHIPQSTSKQRFVLMFYSSNATYTAKTSNGTIISFNAPYFEYTPIDLNDYLLVTIDNTGNTSDVTHRIFSHISDVNDSNCCLPISDSPYNYYNNYNNGNIDLTEVEDTNTPQVFFQAYETKNNSFGFYNNVGFGDSTTYDLRIKDLYSGSVYEELTGAGRGQGIMYCQNLVSTKYLFCIAKKTAGNSWELRTSYADNQC